METPKRVVFVVKRYAVRETEKWQYAVRKAKIGQYAVRKGGVTLIYIQLMMPVERAQYCIKTISLNNA